MPQMDWSLMIFVGTSRSNFSSGSPGGGCLKTWMDELGGHEDFYRRWQYRTLKLISQEQQSWTSNYFNWTDPLESTTQISQKLPTAAVFCCNRSSDRILSRHCGGNTKSHGRRNRGSSLLLSTDHGVLRFLVISPMAKTSSRPWVGFVRKACRRHFKT